MDVNGKRIGIFVIAYNAEKHILQTLERIPKDVWDAVDLVYVIDDCSTDDTVFYAKKCTMPKDKLRVLRNPVNKRYGGNQKFGYQYAIDHHLDMVVMLHADGQYAPEYLLEILQPLIDDKADVVLGSRMMNPGEAIRGGMPKYKYWGNTVLTWIETRMTGLYLTEFHSGYRAYSTHFLSRIPFWENSDEWHFDTQILLQAKQAKCRITEVPIPTHYGDEICHVNGVVYALNCITSCMVYALHRLHIVYGRKYAVSEPATLYRGKFDDPYSSHSIIWDNLNKEPLAGMTILELGVGDASLTQRMQRAGGTIDCVEMDRACADAARPFCRNVYCARLETLDQLLDNQVYDVVIAADVLEHLVFPEKVLSQLKGYTRVGGRLFVSLPNIANLYVRINLLLGRWPTNTRGILDESHLHHYTLTSMKRLLAKTGWKIDSEQASSIPWVMVFPFIKKRPFRWTIALWYRLTVLFKGLLAYQGLFTCHNPNSPEER